MMDPPSHHMLHSSQTALSANIKRVRLNLHSSRKFVALFHFVDFDIVVQKIWMHIHVSLWNLCLLLILAVHFVGFYLWFASFFVYLDNYVVFCCFVCWFLCDIHVLDYLIHCPLGIWIIISMIYIQTLNLVVDEICVIRIELLAWLAVELASY